MSGFAWPWVLPVVAVGVVGLVGWWARRPRVRRPDDALLVAHTALLRRLPRYRRLAARRRWGGALLAVAALVVVVGAALVVARPQVVRTGVPETKSRDLMLCLDASTSMDRDNGAVVDQMKQIVAGLRGDRVGLVIWSGAAVLVFPLTDDYDYVDTQLDRAREAFEGDPSGFFSGVDVIGQRASLIGDGVVSCVNRFDQPAAERTRAVVVSSDDEPLGSPAYSLSDAARYAAARHVVVFGIGATSLADPKHAAARQEFAAATAATGGTLEVLGQTGSADVVVRRIDDLERQRADLPPRRVTVDRPELGRTLCVVGVGLLLLVWLAGLVATVGRRRSRRRSAVAPAPPAVERRPSPVGVR